MESGEKVYPIQIFFSMICFPGYFLLYMPLFFFFFIWLKVLGDYSIHSSQSSDVFLVSNVVKPVILFF